MMANAPIVFDSRLEKSIATSSASAELKAGNRAIGDGLFMERVNTEVGPLLRPRPGPRTPAVQAPTTEETDDQELDITRPEYAALPEARSSRYDEPDQLEYKPLPMYVDATSALQNMEHIPVSRKMRHVSIALGKAREYQREGLMIAHKIPGEINPADEGTKVNTASTHDRNWRFITNQRPT